MQHKFTENQKMSDLIHENHSLLLVISRFGLHLGFGNNTVSEVCQANGIDCATFLAVVNFLSEDNFEVYKTYNDISIDTVVDYLKNAHSYFLDFKLPAIRNKLFEAVSQPEQSLPYGQIFMKFFDEYVLEVQKHMEYENNTVFTYAKLIASGKKEGKYSIDTDKGNNHLLTEVLFDILSCEIDIMSHNKVEDYFFIPAVEAIERKFNAAK